MAETQITEQNFAEEVLQSKIPVLLDFWASWCGPCRMLAPVLKVIAEENEGVIKVGKVNVDEEAALAAAYQITSIPTVIAFKSGKPVKTSIGYVSKEAILSLLK